MRINASESDIYYLDVCDARYCHGGLSATADTIFVDGDHDVKLVGEVIEIDAKRFYANTSYEPEDGETVRVQVVEVTQ